MEIINADKRAAAELYVRVENSKLPVDFVHEIISKPEIVFTTTPQRTMQFANFLHEIGSLDPAPKNWKDLFWETVQDRKSVVAGKSVSVRLDLGGRRIIKKKKIYENTRTNKQ